MKSSFLRYIRRYYAQFGIVATLTLAGTGFLAGCNTMDGLGEDIEKVGEEIQESVDQ